MSFAFRVIHRKDGTRSEYWIGEVLLDAAGTINRRSLAGPIMPIGDTVEALREELQAMLAALELPVEEDWVASVQQNLLELTA